MEGNQIGETSNLFINSLHFKQFSNMLFISVIPVSVGWHLIKHSKHWGRLDPIFLHLRAGEAQLKDLLLKIDSCLSLFRVTPYNL